MLSTISAQDNYKVVMAREILDILNKLAKNMVRIWQLKHRVKVWERLWLRIIKKVCAGRQRRSPAWKSVTLYAINHPTSRFLPNCTKDSLPPALVLNIGTGRKSWGAETSNMEISPRNTGLENQRYPPSPDIHVHVRIRWNQRKEWGVKYSSCKLLTNTVIQDCVCDCMCMCVHKPRPAEIR